MISCRKISPEVHGRCQHDVDQNPDIGVIATPEVDLLNCKRFIVSEQLAGLLSIDIFLLTYPPEKITTT